MRAGFDLYRAFEKDGEDLNSALEEEGKLEMPCLGLYGEMSLFEEVTEEMGLEFAEDVTTHAIPKSGHWMAEENPDALVDTVLDFDPKMEK